MADVPITRETLGNYQPLQAQYSTLPARVQAQVSQGLIEGSQQIYAQSQKSYLMGLSTTMKQELARIESNNLGNPEAMEASFASFKKGYLEKVQGDEARSILEEQYVSETMPYLRRAQGTQRERVDNTTATQGLTLVQQAKDHIVKNSSGIFSNDPGAVFDATRNMEMQAASIQEVAGMTKSDGSPMWTPEQRARMLDIPNASLQEVAGLDWSQKTDAEKISIVQKAMENNGLPANKGADTVQPYTREKIQAVHDKVDAPSEYDPIFRAAAAQYGVDWKELKLRAVVESNLNPKADGPETPNGQSGGIMQLTEETAKGLGVKDRYNPEQAIFGGAKLLADHMQTAGNDRAMVDKLYYGGPDQKKWGANTEQYAENLRAVRAGGAGETGTSFDYLPPAYKAKAYEEMHDLMNVNAMKFASPEERKKIVETSGSDKVLAAAVKIGEALKADPAAYVAQSPDVQAAFNEYANLKTTDSFNKYINNSMALQEKMGVPPYARKVLPNVAAQAHVSEIMDAFASNQNVMEKMQGLQQTYGEYWPRVSQELQAAKLPPAATVLGSMTHPTQAPYGRLLSQGVSEGVDNVLKAIGPDAKKDIHDALAGNLDDFRESTQRVRGGTELIDAVTDATAVLAAKLMQTQGLSASQAARSAAGAIANDYYDYQGTYKLPKDLNVTAINQGASHALNTINEPLLPPEQGQYAEDAYLTSVKAFGYWVNTPEGDGLMMKDSSGNYVRYKDGSYLRYTYDQLSQSGAQMQKDVETLDDITKPPPGSF